MSALTLWVCDVANCRLDVIQLLLTFELNQDMMIGAMTSDGGRETHLIGPTMTLKSYPLTAPLINSSVHSSFTRY